jgi:hypothetical protein
MRPDGKFYWVFEPVREVIVGHDIIGQAQKLQREYDMSHVAASRVDGKARLALCNLDKNSPKQHFDFAEQVRLDYLGVQNFIYIEKLSNSDEIHGQYLYVYVRDGEIQLDAQCDIEQVIRELNYLVKRKHFIENKGARDVTDEGNVELFTYGMPEELVEDYCQKLGCSSPKIFSKALTETTQPMDENSFVREEGLKARLTPKGLYKRWLPLVAVTVLLVAGLDLLLGQEASNTQVQTIKDPWEKYVRLMGQSAPQASNRFAQDYNNLRAFNATLVGWDVVEVNHTKQQNLVYKLVNTGGYTETLASTVQSISKRFGIAMVNDISRDGTIVTVKGANIPPYKAGHEERWNLRTLYQTFTDDVEIFIPTATVSFLNFETPDPTSHVWRAIKLQLSLNGAVIDDLLKLSAATKHKPITMVGGSYRFVDGKINGNITLVLNGEEKW